MKKTIIGLVLVLMAVSAQAHLYSSDYEDYTVGLTISSQSGTWWSPGGTGVVAVDPLDAGNQCVDMSGGATTFWLSGYGYDDVTDPVVQIEFDVYISDTSSRSLTYAVVDNDTSDVIYTAWGGGGAGTINRSSWNSGGWVSHAAPTVDATWMHATYVLDQLNDKFSLNVDGTDVMVNEELRNPSITANTSTFDVGSGYTVLIDNINVTSVPEPTTCLLLGIGGLLLRRKR